MFVSSCFRYVGLWQKKEDHWKKLLKLQRMQQQKWVRFYTEGQGYKVR